MLGASTTASAFWWESTYTKTQYPIVLVHGISGFDNFGGVIDYFHTIPYNLERSGAKVYTPAVAAFATSEVRGEQLADYLNQLPEAKFNLIGHSQGSPTSRVAAALVPHKVASVTSINGVNTGTAVADIVLELFPDGTIQQDIVASIGDAFGDFINFLSGANFEQDALGSAHTLSTPGTTLLNDALDWKGVSTTCSSGPEDVDISGYNIKMFSFGGNTPFTNFLDASDYFLTATSVAFQGVENDGLTSVCSSKLGNVIGIFEMNHVDAVNHIFGVRGAVNVVSLYRSHANRLKNKDL